MSKGHLPKDIGAARSGQMTPTQPGHTPDKTKMGHVAKVAAGSVGSKGNQPSMPKGQIDKHNK